MNNCFKRELAIDITKYETNLVICIENAMLAANYSKDTSTVAEKLEKFSYKEWIS